MQPNKVDITQLRALGHSFYIPFYQRAYVWTEKLWSRFIRDMKYSSLVFEMYSMSRINRLHNFSVHTYALW